MEPVGGLPLIELTGRPDMSPYSTGFYIPTDFIKSPQEISYYNFQLEPLSAYEMKQQHLF